MYSWEIQSYFEKRNYKIEDYLSFHKILLESPQINLVQLKENYESKCKYFVSTTDNFNFYFWLIKKEE